jgi:hypothetical protein
MRVPSPGNMSTGQVAQTLLALVKENYHLAQQMALSRTIICRTAEKLRNSVSLDIM